MYVCSIDANNLYSINDKIDNVWFEKDLENDPFRLDVEGIQFDYIQLLIYKKIFNGGIFHNYLLLIK